MAEEIDGNDYISVSAVAIIIIIITELKFSPDLICFFYNKHPPPTLTHCPLSSNCSYFTLTLISSRLQLWNSIAMIMNEMTFLAYLSHPRLNGKWKQGNKITFFFKNMNCSLITKLLSSRTWVFHCILFPLFPSIHFITNFFLITASLFIIISIYLIFAKHSSNLSIWVYSLTAIPVPTFYHNCFSYYSQSLYSFLPIWNSQNAHRVFHYLLLPLLQSLHFIIYFPLLQPASR